jgi:hypothetical protein
MVLQERIELSASPLPRGCSTTELLQRIGRDRATAGARAQDLRTIQRGMAHIINRFAKARRPIAGGPSHALLFFPAECASRYPYQVAPK